MFQNEVKNNESHSMVCFNGVLSRVYGCLYKRVLFMSEKKAKISKKEIDDKVYQSIAYLLQHARQVDDELEELRKRLFELENERT